jgi:hypothetical protein
MNRITNMPAEFGERYRCSRTLLGVQVSGDRIKLIRLQTDTRFMIIGFLPITLIEPLVALLISVLQLH